MSSLNAILSTAASGMQTAQTGIGVTSDNVANLNTPGYVEKVIGLNSQSVGGVGIGVEPTAVQLASNQFLQNASLAASAGASESSVVSSMLGQAQSFFGDPGSTSGYFNLLNQVATDFQAAANDPASSLSGIQVVNDVNQFLDQSRAIQSSLSQLSGQADTQIGSDVAQANQLLGEISSLNADIANATASGADPTNSQEAQNELVNQLSSLLDIKAQPTASGGVTLTTNSGVLLVGQGGAATLGYQPSTTAAGQLTVSPLGGGQPSSLTLASGEIAGLLSLRNVQLPGVQAQVSQYVSQAVNALNQAHNAASTVPPPATLTGQNIGTDLATAIGGFSGTTNIAIVNASGQLQEQVAIDFSAGTISVDGGAGTAFTPATFLSSLNTALGPFGSATFSNGVLSLSANGAGNGVAIADDSTTPSAARNGEGFSQYFGLNNLVSSGAISNFQTGLAASDPSDFPAGQTLTLRVSNGQGGEITDVTVTTPGGSVQALVNALNSPTGGVGLYGQFSLSASGELSFAPATPGGASLSVVQDNTQSTAGGESVSQLFGIGAQQRALPVSSFAVRSDIAADPSKVAFATLNLGAGAGQPVLAAGDGSGALLEANANATVRSFDAAGSLAAMSTTINQYGAELAGALGNQAANAAQASTNAQAVQTEANSRLQSIQGVNLDQELINLTTYQQAYNASARLVTASNNMFQALMNMVP
ncbi:MAG TPA: flagellar basal body rod C-terminal domain-containing protein [Caulobacteraceae bacterium]|nr:flagellar basal body rod C-terminal domain-containing protein [Caulobacteraceae bacterium]